MLDIPNGRGAAWIPDSILAVQEQAILRGCRVRLIRRRAAPMRKLFYVNDRLCEVHVSTEFAEKSDRLVEFQTGNMRRAEVYARIFRANVPSHEPVHFIVQTSVLATLFPDNPDATVYMPIAVHESLKFYHRLWLLYREAWHLLK
ncbi:MAG TPA: hypothetical protein VHD38_02620 [Candidatus Paceibacterota bacterium]|nr:hypothetical protein [Candidatus Paceibacterota bacterium]